MTKVILFQPMTNRMMTNKPFRPSEVVYQYHCPLADIELIPLTRGHYAIVDREDYEYLNQFKWHANKKNSGEYAARLWPGKKKRMYMHRLLTDCPDGKVVHHRNHVTLDNRRCNMLVCTKAVNNLY